MAVNDIFKKTPVEIPNKSGFDMSNEVLATMMCGTLVPIHHDLLLPNDTVSLGVSAEVQLPPMATDFYGRVKMHFETFFVPFRILYGGWQELITHPVNGDVWPSGTSIQQKAKYLPTLRVPIASGWFAAGSLADYLGYGFKEATAPIATSYLDIKNPLKFLAYHKIWDDFYRDSRLQQSAFMKDRSIPSVTSSTVGMASMPYITIYDSSPTVFSEPSSLGTSPLTMADGVKCFSLRQRCFGKDYFTNSTPLPQAGQPASVAFGVSNNQGAFTIASLRAANSLQMWLERNNVAGYRYGDQIRAHFGVYPSDAALDRPLYLGRQVVDVYNKTVFQNDGNTSSSNTNNPFASVGAKYGSPLGVGSGSLCDTFTAKEHGYLMTIASLVPDSLYSSVIDKDVDYNSSADFPFPLLAGVGDQPILGTELAGGEVVTEESIKSVADAIVFGYTQRYAQHKFKIDRVHGLLRDGESLSNFALKRAFSNYNVALGTQFLEIPTTYLDDVAAVQGDVSKYGCWCDLFFKYHKISTLPAYSIPTLGEPKNTHTEVIETGGTRL